MQRREASWDDLEEAFFAAAPPDVPATPAQPDRFDDLDPGVDAPVRARPAPAALERLVAAIAATPWLNRRTITIAIASVMLLIGLSAVVFASR